MFELAFEGLELHTHVTLANLYMKNYANTFTDMNSPCL